MQKRFDAIKKVYDDFHKEMLAKGRLMLKDTGIGYWGITPTTELFALFQRTKLDKHKKFVDLGSGDGRAAVIAALFTNASGVEFDKELHNIAVSLAKKVKSRALLLNDNFLKHSLDKYDYLFIHPDSHIASKLEQKLLNEMNNTAKLVVYGPHYHPKQMRKLDTIDIQGTFVSIFKK